jgi:hypothetical protein
MLSGISHEPACIFAPFVVFSPFSFTYLPVFFTFALSPPSPPPPRVLAVRNPVNFFYGGFSLLQAKL